MLTISPIFAQYKGIGLCIKPNHLSWKWKFFYIYLFLFALTKSGTIFTICNGSIEIYRLFLEISYHL